MNLDTTRSAPQVGPRPSESGLGGHEAGVSGVDEGARMRRFHCENGDEWPGQIVSLSVTLPELPML